MLQFFSSNVLSVLFVFGTVVIIHEFGHFFVAKLLKIRVEAFAVGFGPRLFGFRRGETDYKVCAVPLGGYVKMAGENPHEDLTGGIEEFLSRPKWQRFLVAVMGPVMNILLAVFLLAGLYYHKHEVPAWINEPVVAKIIESDSPAEKAGILPGDRIVAIGEKRDPTWEEFSIDVATSANHPLELEIDRKGERRQITVTPESQGRNRSGYLGISPFPATLVRVKEVRKGEPAAAAGILPGDKLVRVGSYDLDKVTKELPEILQLEKGEVVPIVVSRNGQLLELKVRPYVDPRNQRRMIGIGIEGDPTQFKMIVKKLTVVEAFRESIKQNAKFATLIFDILQKLIRREVSLRMIEGPIGIARQSGLAAKSGFDDLLFLMAAISLNLGIMNLLPIPVLDGGVIAIILIETLIRRDLSLNLREKITQVGFVVLILLAVVVTYNDIIKTLPASLEKYFP
jgi:regulator of sigma E protease